MNREPRQIRERRIDVANFPAQTPHMAESQKDDSKPKDSSIERVFLANDIFCECNHQQAGAVIMKKLIITLACGAALICGCNKQTSDSEKIEVLSQKLNAVLKFQSITISNQFVISKEISTVKNIVTNLPTLEQVNDLNYFYHNLYYTNLLTKMAAVSTNEMGLVADCFSDMQKRMDASLGQIKQKPGAAH